MRKLDNSIYGISPHKFIRYLIFYAERKVRKSVKRIKFNTAR
jgi:hypothetical protein